MNTRKPSADQRQLVPAELSHAVAPLTDAARGHGFDSLRQVRVDRLRARPRRLVAHPHAHAVLASRVRSVLRRIRGSSTP